MSNLDLSQIGKHRLAMAKGMLIASVIGFQQANDELSRSITEAAAAMSKLRTVILEHNMRNNVNNGNKIPERSMRFVDKLLRD
jgi:hypothetical protein